ncbi:MAG: NADH-ubiquinone oxidoreductase-F iron-sulfur binding region domain-containing protein [bacterium]
MTRITSRKEFDAFTKKLKGRQDPKKRVVSVCGTGCSAVGSLEVIDALRNEVAKRGLADAVEVRKTGCHGFCERGPIVTILPEDYFYNKVTVEDVPEIIEKTIRNGELVERLLYLDPQTGKRCAHTNDVPFYAGQMRKVFKHNGSIDPTDIEAYIAVDGYQGLVKALFEMEPGDVIEEVKDAGLRGRGGGGFLTGLKWEFCRKAHGEPKYVICNADEGDPGAFMDRSILEGNPHAVIEGMLIAAYGIGSEHGYIYVRAEYPLAIRYLLIAVEQAESIGLLGEHILGTDFSFDLKIKQGAGAFVCGEETALIASIEGKRGMPRSRPPFPAHQGVWGKPTNINNVETFANVPLIILEGAKSYAEVGTDKSKGTKIFALAGKINNTGLVEVPLGTSLRDVIYTIGGGIPKGRKFKAVQLGGPSGGCIPAQHLDTPIDYDSLQDLGAIMGSGGMIVMDENTCMVDIARYFLEFVQSESCGKCIPCRVGTKRMLEILIKITEGRGQMSDLDLLEELAVHIKNTALCGLGQTAPNPVLSTLRYFRDEYETHILYQKCPAASCEMLFLSPCEHVCPLGTDVPNYVNLIAEGRFSEALAVVREKNPFPGVCGRVCNHPCQVKCRRGEIDDPIAIADLKRVAADYGETQSAVPTANIRWKNERVAVIGGGPSGLTAAYFLGQLGFRVTLFEAMPVLGGMLAWAIPEYRLPKKTLDHEIRLILPWIAELKTSTKIGKDVPFESLLSGDFRALYIAVGAPVGIPLTIPGSDLDGVWDGLSFLTQVSFGKRPAIGDRVCVIGGGNVATDAARTALRLGAREVTICYRREREDMPALDEEILEAEEEGVAFLFLTIPLEIKGTKGRMTGLVCQKAVLGETGPDGRRRPVPSPGTEYLLACDTIIGAIGQRLDLAFLPEAIQREICSGNRIAAEVTSGRTCNPMIFAGGDVVTGPNTVIDAIAAGRKAALAISECISPHSSRHLRVISNERILYHEVEVDESMGDARREPMPHTSARQRIKGFSEVKKGYTPQKAIREARRCLKCNFEKMMGYER